MTRCAAPPDWCFEYKIVSVTARSVIAVEHEAKPLAVGARGCAQVGVDGHTPDRPTSASIPSGSNRLETGADQATTPSRRDQTGDRRVVGIAGATEVELDLTAIGAAD